MKYKFSKSALPLLLFHKKNSSQRFLRTLMLFSLGGWAWEFFRRHQWSLCIEMGFIWIFLRKPWKCNKRIHMCKTCYHIYQNMIKMTRDFTSAVAFRFPYKCPRKTHIDTQWYPALSYFHTKKFCMGASSNWCRS